MEEEEEDYDDDGAEENGTPRKRKSLGHGQDNSNKRRRLDPDVGIHYYTTAFIGSDSYPSGRSACPGNSVTRTRNAYANTI